MSKLVSIIIPVYNRGAFLLQTLASVAAQTYTNWQLVIVDDGSTDNSLEVVEAFAQQHTGKCSILHSGKAQSGAAACRNIGLQNAAGEYIVFLDSDDLLAPICLAQRVAVLVNDFSLDWAIFMQNEWTENQLPPYKLFNKPVTTREQAVACFLQMDPPWQTMAPIWKKQVLLSLKGFDESLVYMEDPDLHLRALLQVKYNMRIMYDLPADCYYRIDNQDATKSDRFYHNSIVSRFAFLHKHMQGLPAALLNTYSAVIRKGVIDFIKVMVLARIKSYDKELHPVIKILQDKKILTGFDAFKLSVIRSVFLSNSLLIKKSRMRGLVYKWL